MEEKVPLFVELYKREDIMLNKIIEKYGFHSKAEFIREVIRRIYTDGKVEFVAIDIKPLQSI